MVLTTYAADQSAADDLDKDDQVTDVLITLFQMALSLRQQILQLQ